jgi:hypothetical protein
MTFRLETPDVLEIESVNPPTAVPEPEHVHPHQESGCRVLSGVLKFSVAGHERTIAAGESITIAPDTAHYFWNPGPDEAQAIQWFRPALKTRAFFETLFALARDGKMNEKGMPNTLQIAAMIPFFADEIRPTRPPWPVQRAIGAALGPIAHLCGYRGNYEASGPG